LPRKFDKGVNMLKKISISILIIVCFSLIGCSVQNKASRNVQEYIRYTTTDKNDIKVINSEKTVNNLKSMVNSIEWSDKVFTKPDSGVYSFWFETESKKERIGMYDLWSNQENTVIFNEKTGKYGLLSVDDKIMLKEIFSWWK
jgi:hypothetical protein